MADRYGFWRLLAEGLRGHTGWKPAWRDPEPKAEYDVIIIGGGGHGLATAYYLAKNHGITNVAVLERLDKPDLEPWVAKVVMANKAILLAIFCGTRAAVAVLVEPKA